MKTIVVYNSKTGFTKKYGEWIAKDLACEALPVKVAVKKLEDYDTIIFGGWIMGGKIVGLEEIKNNPKLNSKKLIVYATGATNMKAKDLIDKMKTDNFTEAERNVIPFFFFESGINFENMGFMSKSILKVMRKMLISKKDKSMLDKSMIDLFEKSSDQSNPENIKPLLDYVKNNK